MSDTYYTVLGVSETASQNEIKQAYRDLIRQVHPDSIPNASPYWKHATEEKSKEVNEAYRVLSNVSQRSLYDRQLAEHRQQSTETSQQSQSPRPEPAANTCPTCHASPCVCHFCAKCGTCLVSGLCPKCGGPGGAAVHTSSGIRPSGWNTIFWVAVIGIPTLFIMFNIFGNQSTPAPVAATIPASAFHGQPAVIHSPEPETEPIPDITAAPLTLPSGVVSAPKVFAPDSEFSEETSPQTSPSALAAQLQSVVVSRGFEPADKAWLVAADTVGNKLLIQLAACKGTPDGNCKKLFIAFNGRFLGSDTYNPSWDVHDVTQERVGSFSAIYEDLSDPNQKRPPTKVTYTWDGHRLTALGTAPTRTSGSEFAGRNVPRPPLVSGSPANAAMIKSKQAAMDRFVPRPSGGNVYRPPAPPDGNSTTSTWYAKESESTPKPAIGTQGEGGTAQPETWTDPATGLMRPTQDNSRLVTWYEATNYCASLTLGGYSNWRLPSIDELQGMWDPTPTVLGWHIKGEIKSSAYAGSKWSTTPYGSGAAYVFFFNGNYKPGSANRGSRLLYEQGASALCVHGRPAL